MASMWHEVAHLHHAVHREACAAGAQVPQQPGQEVHLTQSQVSGTVDFQGLHQVGWDDLERLHLLEQGHFLSRANRKAPEMIQHHCAIVPLNVEGTKRSTSDDSNRLENRHGRASSRSCERRNRYEHDAQGLVRAHRNSPELSSTSRKGSDF